MGEAVKNDKKKHLRNRTFSHIPPIFHEHKNGIQFSSSILLIHFPFPFQFLSINILVCLLSITLYHFPSQLILMIDSQTSHAGSFGRSLIPLIRFHSSSRFAPYFENWLLSHLIFHCVSSSHFLYFIYATRMLNTFLYFLDTFFFCVSLNSTRFSSFFTYSFSFLPFRRKSNVQRLWSSI